MAPRRRCIVQGCRTESRIRSFPYDLEIRRQWCLALGIADSLPSRHNTRVCDRHFTPDCFSNMMEYKMGFAKMLKLKSDAVPTIALQTGVHPPLQLYRSPLHHQGAIRLEPKPTREIGCQTEPVITRSIFVQANVKPPFRSKATQTRPTGRSVSCSTGTLTVMSFPECHCVPADSDGVPEMVYFVGEEIDPMELSDVSSGPGDTDSGDDWDPENNLFLDEELQTKSNETSDDEDAVPELCTECGTFMKKNKPHTCEHKIKPLPCNSCGKRFANELALAIHTRRMHSTDKEFSCKYCHVKFKTRFNRTTHEQTHLTEEKPYKCPKCPETFASYPAYKTHLDGHGRLKELNCQVCAVEFSNSFHLKRHLVVHSVEKPYKCSECSRGFTQAGNLKVHMRLHSGEKPFRCQHCDQIFRHNVSLKSHVKRFHKPSSENQQKTNGSERDSGDSPANENMEVADSLLLEAEQQTDDVQIETKVSGQN